MPGASPHLGHERLKELDDIGMPHRPGVINRLASPRVLGLVINEDVGAGFNEQLHLESITWSS